MHIHCLSLNHRSANVHLRERLAFPVESVKAALARLGCGYGAAPEAISEMVILSTCNRVEIYATAVRPAMDILEHFLAEVRGVALEEFRPHLVHFTDEDAVEHLFQVAAGLDSLVLGEPQILGQVMQAFEMARGQSAAGPILSRLFQAALHAGKRARTETAISHNPASISSVAVRLAEKVVPHLASARVVVLGAGEMAELAVEALRKRGVFQITVANRTLERARQLAERWGGEAATFEQLSSLLPDADILITSTGAPHTIIHPAMIAEAMQARQGRSMVIIDIAVPRDVAAEVGSLPGVQLFDIDALYLRLETSLARRSMEIPAVQAILAAEQADFMEFLLSLDVLPVIAAMNQQAESIRLVELEKTLRHLPELSSAERERLEALTQALVKKLLHAPINHLRAEAGGPRSAECAAAARDLFGIQHGRQTHVYASSQGT